MWVEGSGFKGGGLGFLALQQGFEGFRGQMWSFVAVLCTTMRIVVCSGAGLIPF